MICWNWWTPQGVTVWTRQSGHFPISNLSKQRWSMPTYYFKLQFTSYHTLVGTEKALLSSCFVLLLIFGNLNWWKSLLSFVKICVYLPWKYFTIHSKSNFWYPIFECFWQNVFWRLFVKICAVEISFWWMLCCAYITWYVTIRLIVLLKNIFCNYHMFCMCHLKW